MYVCSRGIDFAGFYDFSVGFGTVPTVWYFFYIPFTQIHDNSLS
jgi:hypothetical protein